jgi:hypothetical protein
MAASSRDVFPIGRQWALQYKDSTKTANGNFNSSPSLRFDEDELKLNIDSVLECQKIYAGIADGEQGDFRSNPEISADSFAGTLEIRNRKINSDTVISFGTDFSAINGFGNSTTVPRDTLLYPLADPVSGEIGDTFIGASDVPTPVMVGRRADIKGANCVQDAFGLQPGDPAFPLYAGNVHVKSGDSTTYGNGGSILVQAGDCAGDGTRAGTVYLGHAASDPGSGLSQVNIGVSENQEKGGFYIISNGVRYELPKDAPANASDRMQIAEMRFNYDASFGNNKDGIAQNFMDPSDPESGDLTQVGLSLTKTIAIAGNRALGCGQTTNNAIFETRSTTSATLPGPITDVVYMVSDSLYVCCGDGFIATTANVETEEWTVVVSAPGTVFACLRIGNGNAGMSQCLALASNTTTSYYTFTGGSSFFPTTLPVGMTDFTGAFHDNVGGFWCVCTSSGTSQIATSTDFSSWSAIATGFEVPFYDIVSYDGKFVLAHEPGFARTYEVGVGFASIPSFGRRFLYSLNFQRIYLYDPASTIAFQTQPPAQTAEWDFLILTGGGNSFPKIQSMQCAPLNPTTSVDFSVYPKIAAHVIRNDRHEFYTSTDGRRFEMDYILVDVSAATVPFTPFAVAHAPRQRQMVYVLASGTQMFFNGYSVPNTKACLQLYDLQDGKPIQSFGLNGIRYIENPEKEALGPVASTLSCIAQNTDTNQIVVCGMYSNAADALVLGDPCLFVLDASTLELVDPQPLVLVPSPNTRTYNPSAIAIHEGLNRAFVVLSEDSYQAYTDPVGSALPPRVVCVDLDTRAIDPSFGSGGFIDFAADFLFYGYSQFATIADIVVIGDEIVMTGFVHNGTYLPPDAHVVLTSSVLTKYSAVNGARVDAFGDIGTPGYVFGALSTAGKTLLVDAPSADFMLVSLLPSVDQVELTRRVNATGALDPAFAKSIDYQGDLGLDPRLYYSSVVKDDLGAYWLAVKQNTGYGAIPEYGALFAGSFVYRYLAGGDLDKNFGQNGVLFVRVEATDPTTVRGKQNHVDIGSMLLLPDAPIPSIVVAGNAVYTTLTTTDDTLSPEYVQGRPTITQSALIKINTNISYALDVILQWAP